MTLQCESFGGNPLATLHWSRDGQQIDTTYQTQDQYKAVNDYTFTVAEADNAAVFLCEASNPSLAAPLAEEKRLRVEFAPSDVKVSRPQHLGRHHLTSRYQSLPVVF